MATIFHNIPQDAETVAGVREGCTRRGFMAACGDRRCRRQGRCAAPWTANEGFTAILLPPCLSERYDKVIARIVDAEIDLTELRLIIAEARKLPHADYIAELDHFDEDLPARVAEMADVARTPRKR